MHGTLGEYHPKCGDMGRLIKSNIMYSERVKETSPLGSGNSRSLEDIIKQARLGLSHQDNKAADNLNMNIIL